VRIRKNVRGDVHICIVDVGGFERARKRNDAVYTGIGESGVQDVVEDVGRMGEGVSLLYCHESNKQLGGFSFDCM